MPPRMRSASTPMALAPSFVLTSLSTKVAARHVVRARASLDDDGCSAIEKTLCDGSGDAAGAAGYQGATADEFLGDWGSHDISFFHGYEVQPSRAPRLPGQTEATAAARCVRSIRAA